MLGGRARGNTRVRGRKPGHGGGGWGRQVCAPAPGICSHLFLQDPIVEIADKDAKEAERQAQPVGQQGAAGGHETPGRPDRRPAHSRQRQRRRRRRQLQPDIADRRQGPHRSCMRPPLSRPRQPPPELPAQSLREGKASRPKKCSQGKDTRPGTLPSFLMAERATVPTLVPSPSALPIRQLRGQLQLGARRDGLGAMRARSDNVCGCGGHQLVALCEDRQVSWKEAGRANPSLFACRQ